MSDISIFPRPKNMVMGGKRLFLGSIGSTKCVLIRGSGGDLVREALEKIVHGIETKIGVKPMESTLEGVEGGENVRITIGTNLDLVNHPEAYSIRITNGMVEISGSDDAGTFYGAVTFNRLLKMENGKLYVDEVEISDYPDYRHRGLYVESKWGPDLMTLEDWKEAIDYIADLKMNFLGVGIYGCWHTQYNREITEFLMVPIKQYPQLTKVERIKYYSSKNKRWENLCYLPRIYSENFFKEVIAYGARRNVIVRPEFNSFGHNTLIPRFIPEISSIDSHGKPTGYGFCLSNPNTYKVLFNIFDEIIYAYLLPNGIDWFHLGLDEVYPLMGINQDDLHKPVDPWCKCTQCQMVSKEELFTRFLLKVASHLKKRGIHNITVWYDQLARHMNILNEDFVRRVEEADLKDNLILNWWYYGFEIPETVHPELGLRTFVSPMAGYFFWMNYVSYLSNIYSMLKLGGRDGSEGCEAYCVFDPAFDRNYHAVAEYSWNQYRKMKMEDFKELYEKIVFGSSAEKVRDAMEAFDNVVDPGDAGMLGRFFNPNLAYYLYTYVQANMDYPRDYPGEAFTRLYMDIEGSKNKMCSILSEIRKAREGFQSLSPEETNSPRLLEEYIVECLRYEKIIEAMLEIIEIKESYDTLKNINEVLTLIDRAKKVQLSVDGLIRIIENTKKEYLVPQILRDLLSFRNFTLALVAFLTDVMKTGEYSELSLTNTLWVHKYAK